MAKKQPTNFENRLHKAELRAKRKLRRLQNKGVRITGINPLQPMDTMSTGQKRAYENQLEKFIARQNRIVAGYEGVPIHYDIVKQIRKQEKKLNSAREKQFNKIAQQPLLVPGADMTVEDYRAATRQYSSKSKSLIPNPKGTGFASEIRHRDIGMIKSEKEAMEYIARLEKLGTREYVDYKNNIMIENMLKVVKNFNEPELEKRIKRLTAEQIYVLVQMTPFVESVFMNDSNPASPSVLRGVVDHLYDILDSLEF